VNVALFVTCLVDLFRPSVAFAAIRLLERHGCTVSVPAAQTCCGQPGYNGGDRASAQALARQVIASCEGYEHIVVPSGSCGGMLRHHYPALLADDPVWAERARAFAAKAHELIAFLTGVLGVRAVEGSYAGTIAYHDSCSSLREIGIREEPRALLRSVRGLALAAVAGGETCCGFGGAFCVKYPAISVEMARRKTAAITASGADTLLAGDLGCLLHLAGRLKREGSRIRVRHVAEVLAGNDAPPIGEA